MVRIIPFSPLLVVDFNSLFSGNLESEEIRQFLRRPPSSSGFVAATPRARGFWLMRSAEQEIFPNGLTTTCSTRLSHDAPQFLD